MPQNKRTAKQQLAELFAHGYLINEHGTRRTAILLAEIIDAQQERIRALEERLDEVEGTAARVAHRTRGMDVIGPGPAYKPRYSPKPLRPKS